MAGFLEKSLLEMEKSIEESLEKSTGMSPEMAVRLQKTPPQLKSLKDKFSGPPPSPFRSCCTPPRGTALARLPSRPSSLLRECTTEEKSDIAKASAPVITSAVREEEQTSSVSEAASVIVEVVVVQIPANVDNGFPAEDENVEDPIPAVAPPPKDVVASCDCAECNCCEFCKFDKKPDSKDCSCFVEDKCSCCPACQCLTKLKKSGPPTGTVPAAVLVKTSSLPKQEEVHEVPVC